jgi:hypothetical protein
MKKTILVLGVIGILAALTGCGGGSVSAEKLADKLSKLKANTADTPHTVKLDNTVNISTKGSDIDKVVEAEGKYVILDLSECSVKDNTLDEENPFQDDNEFIKGIILPKSLTTISLGAFFRREHLTGVTIPASVTSIGGEALGPFVAFGQCPKLTNITVAAGNPAYSSADGVLFNKDKTTLLLFPEGRSGSYTIPSSVTGIGAGAFVGCSGLTSVTIPDSVTSIGAGAFSGCSGLTSVIIPAGVTSVGAMAFQTTGLTSVTFASGSAIAEENFGDYAFNADGIHTWSYDPADLDNALRNTYLSGGAGTYLRAEEKRTWTKQ